MSMPFSWLEAVSSSKNPGVRHLTADNDNLPILISIKDASAMTSLSRPQINVLRGDGRFPAAVTLGERRIAFVRSEVIGWANARIAARPAQAAA